MKKVILFALFFCGILSAKAQVSILPKTGIGLGHYRADKAFRKVQVPCLGAVAGVGFNFGVGKQLSLQTELLFIQKGSKMNSGKIPNSQKDQIIKEVVNQIEIPVLIRYAFGNKNIQPYLNGGISLGYRLGGYIKSTYNFLAYSTASQYYGYGYGGIVEQDIRIKVRYSNPPNGGNANTIYSQAERSDVALQAGGGILYKLKKGHLNFDVRYGMSISKIESRIWAFTLGYQIPLMSNKK